MAFILPVAILLGVVALLATSGGGGATTRRAKGNPNITLRFARKWGPVFGAPVPFLMAIAHIESGHNPKSLDMSPRAAAKGGAWGLFAQMQDEASWKLQQILKRAGKRTDVQANVALFDNVGPKALFDPDLNAMLAAWQVGEAVRKFGPNFPLVAAAYHDGQPAVAARLAAGKPAVDEARQPRGFAYVERAKEILPLYKQVG
jgi:soluble lytic murein transglycosylase-like protein